ncbi:MAG: hypothetical protein AB1715_14510, partial [Acidobacteriota bacterium]
MARLTKCRQLFLYAAPFLPLATFKLWASSNRTPGSLLVAALALLAYCLLVLAIARRWDKPTYFDWTVTCYFFIVALALALRPGEAGPVLVNYAVTGIYACLFVAAFAPPLVGLDPFTYHYAK